MDKSIDGESRSDGSFPEKVSEPASDAPGSEDGGRLRETGQTQMEHGSRAAHRAGRAAKSGRAEGLAGAWRSRAWQQDASEAPAS